MELSTAEITSRMGSYMWPFLRIGAMLSVVSIFGAQNLVPTRVRIGLALVLTWLVVPLLPAMPVVEPLSSSGLLITINQLVLGVAMGFITQLAFSALVIGGHGIAMSMGLGFATFLDPNGVSVPVVSQFFVVLGTLLYLMLDGHLVTLQVLVASFQGIPVGVDGISIANIWNLVLWGSQMYVGALLIALPALITIMMINIALGVMTRAAPTLNIFAVGFPITMMAGFIIMFLTIPDLLPRFTDLLMSAFELMYQVSGSTGAIDG
jgi:flagellar biosynthetic protein FliR